MLPLLSDLLGMNAWSRGWCLKDDMADFEQNLAALSASVLKQDGSITNLRRLTGGANAETWAFEYGDLPLILRRRAGGSDAEEELATLTFEQEAEFIKRADAAGVKVPTIYAATSPSDPIGEGILMSRVEGEALPQKLFKDASYQNALTQLVEDCATSLSGIHSIPISDLKTTMGVLTPLGALEQREAQYLGYGVKSPILSFALCWLRQNAPPETETVLCHGDFRVGNLLVDGVGISAVLDWELAFLGDPVSDVAYLCSPPWRFGNYDKPVGGVGQTHELIAAYEAASGRNVDKHRFQWWLIFASVNWCLGCIYMARLWRSGADRELERAVIGTRVSESEIDLLLLFDDVLGIEDALDAEHLAQQTSREIGGETEASELAVALSEWISDDVIPNASGREGFKARVARNAVGILQRSTALGPEYALASAARLSELGRCHEQLSDGLLKGDISLETPAIRHHIKLSALERVLIDQPKHAGLAVALKKWGVT